MYIIHNNNLIARADANISLEDRGFRFGDGVFETIAVINAVPVNLRLHLKRLFWGVKAMKIASKIEAENLRNQCFALIKKNDVSTGILRIFITRGCGSMGYLPSPHIVANVVITANSTNRVKIANITAMGRIFGTKICKGESGFAGGNSNITADVRLAVSSYIKPSPKSYPTAFKIMGNLNSVLSRIEAKEKGVNDVLLLNEQGFISETSSANIFIYDGDMLYTPHIKTGATLGTMRASVIQYYRNNLAVRVKKGNFTLDILQRAKRVFTSNSVMGFQEVCLIKHNEQTIFKLG